MKNFIISCTNKGSKDKLIESLKNKLILSIEENGINSVRTINLSQELDKLIVAKMSRESRIKLIRKNNNNQQNL